VLVPTGNIEVIVSLAAGRIAHVAAERERQKKPLSLERLTAETSLKWAHI
jgi:hypothetical protein